MRDEKKKKRERTVNQSEMTPPKAVKNGKEEKSASRCQRQMKEST